MWGQTSTPIDTTSLIPWEEALVVELRRCLALPLDDITEAMRRYVNPALSRSAIHRCLKRHGCPLVSPRKRRLPRSSKPLRQPASSISMSNTCRRSSAAAPTLEPAPAESRGRHRPGHLFCLPRDPLRPPGRHRRRLSPALPRPFRAQGPHRAHRQRLWTWECAGCGKHTSVTAGTIMHHSKLPLTAWFWAAYLMATHSNGISALRWQRQLGFGSTKRLG